MVWLGTCSIDITPLIIFNEGTVDHTVYIEKALLVALKYRNQVLGNHWIFHQDGAKPQSHYLIQQWCRENFPTFINSENRSPISPYLNPLACSVWNELVNAVNWDKVKLRFNR